VRGSGCTFDEFGHDHEGSPKNDVVATHHVHMRVLFG
jgi:hypothetical protein